MYAEIAALATTVVSSLLMPYLQKGAQTMAEEIARKLGTATADKAAQTAGTIWEKIKKAFTSPGDQKIVSEFEGKPGPDTAQRLIDYLKIKLDQDQQLYQELDQLVQTLNAGSQPGATAHVEVIGNVFKDVHSVEITGNKITGKSS